MKFRIVQNVDGKFVVSETTDIIAWAQVRGLEVVKLNTNPRQRAELQGHPVFGSMCGPMWDGDAVRYEDQASYNHLST